MKQFLTTLTALALFVPLRLSAEEIAPAPAKGRPASALVSLKLDAAATGHTPFKARGLSAGGISVTQAAVGITVPLPPLGEGTYPSVGLDYREYSLDRDANTPLPDRLKSLKAQFTVVRVLNPDWTLIASTGMGVHEAGSTFSSRGLGVGALAIANRKISPTFDAGFGAVYDSLANGTGRMLPVATFEWRAAPEWRVFLGFPRTGAAWQVNPGVSLELVAEADFGSFHVQDDPLPAGTGKPALNRTRLEYQALRVGLAGAWQLTPHRSLRVTAGAVPLLNADYHRRHYKLSSERAAPFVSFALEQKL